MRVTVALGGNALLRRGEPLTADVQRANVLEASAVLSEIARDHETVITHGNGPQVGLLALQAEAYEGVPPYPLDVLGAESEGMLDEEAAPHRLAKSKLAQKAEGKIADKQEPQQ